MERLSNYEAMPDEKIGHRPTFHYRLPNSRIDEAGWSVSREWNIWMRIENLANDDDALHAAMSERIKALRGPIERLTTAKRRAGPPGARSSKCRASPTSRVPARTAGSAARKEANKEPTQLESIPPTLQTMWELPRCGNTVW